eukprot:1995844-Alexandrium_andersonii.AAC.1
MGLGPAGFGPGDEALLAARLLTRPGAEIHQMDYAPTVLARQAVWVMTEEAWASPETDRGDRPSRPGAAGPRGPDHWNHR